MFFVYWVIYTSQKRSFLPLRTLKHDETLKNLEENSDAERKEINPTSTSSFFNNAQQTLNKYNIHFLGKIKLNLRSSSQDETDIHDSARQLQSKAGEYLRLLC